MTSKEAYNYLLGLLESGGDMRWSLVKESMDKFKELIDQQSNPTFSECIKEWEEKGFEVENTYRYLSFRSIDLNIDITIDKKVRDVQICVCHYNYAQTISFDLHNLIHKTIKALEVENE